MKDEKHETFQNRLDSALAAYPSSSTGHANGIHHAPVGEHAHRIQGLRHLQSTHALAKPEKSLHIGAAGFYNFDIAAITRPDFLLFLDMNPDQQIFWQEVIAMLEANPSAEGFVEDFKSRQDGHGFRTAQGILKQSALADFSDFYFNALPAWLADPEAYAHLRHLALCGHIGTATIDLIHDAKRAEALGNCLRELGLHTHTAYWSNIGSYFEPKRRGYSTSTRDSVYGDMPNGSNLGVLFKEQTYIERERQSVLHTSESIHDASMRAPENLPRWEKFMRNVSAIGGEEGEHFFMHITRKRPLIIHEGPPRRTPDAERNWRARMEMGEAARAANISVLP
jgi:hypothetical protein